LVTDEIDHVEAREIVTADGVCHDVDVIALATGFDAHAFVRPPRSSVATASVLDDAWRDGPYAHLTVSVPAFPTLS